MRIVKQLKRLSQQGKLTVIRLLANCRHGSWVAGQSAVVIVAVTVRAMAHDAGVSATVDFESQIRPILTEHCLSCHGFDPATRHCGLRLDLRQEAIAGGDSGLPAIVPGNPADSELMRRVTSADTDEVMPPPQAHERPLSSAQVDLIRQWILEGAPYVEHWAFVPPRQPPLSDSGETSSGAMAIDRFVQQHLETLGLKASPPESASVLCRRIYLDLIGLPPTPQQIQEFTEQGIAATVDRLLASERFGEKWARHWLDVARYSDTNGYEKDLKRDQWIWRDWVIDALNADMPYDQFVIEQIAGDLLPAADQRQMVATGFLRNSMINEEGAVIPEEFRMAEMFDRIDCIGKAVLGLTTQCAQCHTHKFDPLTQDEYFGMFAYLNNSYEAQSWVYTEEQLRRIASLQGKMEDIQSQILDVRPTWRDDILQWSRAIQGESPVWEPLEFYELGSVSGLNHPTQQADRSVMMLSHRSDDVFFIARPKLDGITGIRLELLTHHDLPFGGPGRSGKGTWDIREIELFIQSPMSDQWQKLKLVNPTADFSEAETSVEEGKKQLGPIDFLVDGSETTCWRADRGTGRRNSPSVAVVQLESPLEAEEGTKLKFAMRMGEMVGCCRVSLTRCADPKTVAIDYDAQMAASVPEDQRSDSDQAALFAAWRKSVPELSELNQEIDRLWQQYPTAKTSVLHVKERHVNEHRVTRLLTRGEWNQPDYPVQPHVPAALHPLPGSDEPARLQFARWLVDRQSPLAGRVAVNRIWQAIFGQGLVQTSEDFGTRTEMPLYRELLDWLAVDFMDNGWSTKHVIRQIVLSQTYQQTSRSTAELLERDPDNSLLARGPRFRADAEVIRDLAMAVAGLIHHERGGPSIIPPVPQNVLDYNYVYPAYWKPAEGPQRYRRTVYGFRKRSMPDPVMSSFDAPTADFSCARRARSNTPLAALTGLNEPIFVESAQALALRILRESEPTDQHRIEYGFLLCMSRLPSTEETQATLELIQSQRQRVAEGWLNAREITTGSPDRLPELPASVTPQDAAVWTIVARVLLNLDETLCKN
jgi:hypothetical protein